MTNYNEQLKTLISTSFNADELKYAIAPDSLTVNRNEAFEIPPNFVLCRDNDNNVTAMFGDNRWDFNPYRLSASKIRTFNFDIISRDKHSAQKDILIHEMKTILFHLMYSVPAGYTGMLSVSTLYNYYLVLVRAAKYCILLNGKGFLRKITIKDLFSDERLFTAFVIEHQKLAFNSRAKALVKHLMHLGPTILKFDISAIAGVDIERLENAQTVVIPQRIYLLIGDNLESDIDNIYKYSSNLPIFISSLKDKYYGLAHARQKALGVGGKKFYRPNFKQAVEMHGLSELFKGDLIATNRNNLLLALARIQYRCKLAIHYFTGMRNQEVFRLKPHAITNTFASDPIIDDEGKVIDKSKIVEVISTTTKFVGRRVEVSWFAPSEVKKAIIILERIHAGLSALEDSKPHDDWLFKSAALVRPNAQRDNQPTDFRPEHKPSWLEGLKITQVDFNELLNSDDTRDWALEADYQVGMPWPLHTHQFRRSLAFYARSAGFISEASLKSQLKHLSKAMMRYYAKNFEKAESIFGFFNEKTGKYELPPEHIIHEFRTGIPYRAADLLLYDLLGEPLYGKTGSYMERQNEKLRKGEVVIDEVRRETAKRVEKGEFAYRSTLLGGCTKVGNCDNFMLGDFTSCLICDDAVIKESNLLREIELTKKELQLYEKDSGEYQLTMKNLEELERFKKYHIDKRTESREA